MSGKGGNKQGKKQGGSKGGKQHELAITTRAEDYPKWYQDVVRFGELAEPAKVVKGCMVIRPHGYAIWEKIQRDLDARFKNTGHRNAYFPLLVPQSFIMKEAEHIEGFAPELAVVTHAGGQELEEPYVIRPTSETIIGHFFAKWIDSHRDLPLKINQWANVMRWELRTRMFLRTTEFLWQEGHTAHATHEEAIEETLQMLHVYGDFAEEVLAVPVTRGIKTASERFAGALETYCIEAWMQDGKALQAGTSHDLGQNFGKAFDVKFQNEAGDLEHVWQTSWGVSTRLIGGLVMTHSDDDGLVLPPRVAPIHAAIIPIFRKAHEKERVMEAAERLKEQLSAIDIAPERARYRDFLEVVIDDRDMRPGAKFYDWERRGVPMRIELGPKDLDKGQVCMKMRVDTPACSGKQFLPEAEFLGSVRQRLLDYQDALLAAAKARRAANTVTLDTWEEFEATFAGDESKFAWCHWDGTAETEAAIKDKTKVTIRCVPLEGQGPAAEPGTCIFSGKPSKQRVLMAKAY
ncbi:prolyl-tRNA synthetase [Plesiocystis pacifica SIR-1]|uniref:Proline--tRNA ligase n=1 Tax=Plesiocystis pacifica SIR-1 TaxID=391625 RepID=A6G1V0_9BACT|nr:proline--tRNA ligase [Plesiocystis pacifica]EDM80140.1 prolyl-tRNA synthetase [Plesiocystis pacifica SIR-1]